jgi:hypothetical protein
MSNGGVLNTSGSTPVGSGRFPITPFVVGLSGQAGYQTIQSAINAANAAGGGMVWVQPGTYTENLTFYSGIQISSPSEQSVTIIGTHTPPSSGTLNINRMTLQSATNIFSSNAAGTTSIIMEDCSVNATNGYTFNLPNWTASGGLQAFNIGPIGTNDGFLNNSGGMSVAIFAAGVGNGSSNPMVISGSTLFGPGTTIGCPVSVNSGSSIISSNNQYYGTFTFSGNATGNFYNDSFVTGSSAAITYNSSGASSLNNCSVNSSLNPCINGSGAGALQLNSVSYLNNSSLASTLNITYGSAIAAGEIRAGADIGGRTNTTSLTRTSSSTIGAGAGSVKMSSGNAADNAAWIKIYIGTTAYWIPAWTTNAP